MRLPKLYPIIDAATLARAGMSPIEFAGCLAEGGVGFAQFRHKGPYTRETFAVAEEVGKILRQAGALYCIDDRADAALMLGADAVHLGQQDLPPEQVRRLVGGKIAIGLSTHNEEQLRAGDRERVDYLAIGPIFPTASKERPGPAVGLEELARLRAMTGKPLVAIGGITRSNAREVLAAGADSVAVISDLVSDDPAARLREWMDLLE